MNTHGHFRHLVSSLLDVSSLLEPPQVNRWKTSAKSIFLRIGSDHVLEPNVAHNVLKLLQEISELPGLQRFQLVLRGGRGRVRASVLASIVEKAKKITTLEISNAFIIMDTPSAWNTAMKTHQSLTSVALLDCRPSNGSSASLLPTIAALVENPMLTSLLIDSKALHGGGEDVSGVLASIGRSTCLKAFRLRNCRDHGLDHEEQLLPLLQELNNNQSLTELCVYDELQASGRFGATTSAAVAEMLRHNSTLESVMLSLQPANVPPIIDALRDNATLKKLQLHAQYQSCFDAAIETLGEVLRSNFVLEHCQFVGCGVSTSQVIEFFLTLNRLGRHFLLTKQEATTEDWINTVCAHQDRTDVVMYLLRRNPTLMIDQTGRAMDMMKRNHHSVGATLANSAEPTVPVEWNRRHKH
jgi:hypothetical protein